MVTEIFNPNTGEPILGECMVEINGDKVRLADSGKYTKMYNKNLTKFFRVLQEGSSSEVYGFFIYYLQRKYDIVCITEDAMVDCMHKSKGTIRKALKNLVGNGLLFKSKRRGIIHYAVNPEYMWYGREGTKYAVQGIFKGRFEGLKVKHIIDGTMDCMDYIEDLDATLLETSDID